MCARADRFLYHMTVGAAKTADISPMGSKTLDRQERRVWLRLTIASGNAVQLAGFFLGCFALLAAANARFANLAVTEMLAGLFLIYLSCHAIAHWLVGRLVGIRFRSYTLGGTGNPRAWPVGFRWLMEHVPFFGVQTDTASMDAASPVAKAVMWSAGVTSSAVLPTLGALWAWHSEIRAGKAVFLFMLIWSVGTVIANLFGPGGDYFKARTAAKGGARIA